MLWLPAFFTSFNQLCSSSYHPPFSFSILILTSSFKIFHDHPLRCIRQTLVYLCNILQKIFITFIQLELHLFRINILSFDPYLIRAFPSCRYQTRTLFAVLSNPSCSLHCRYFSRLFLQSIQTGSTSSLRCRYFNKPFIPTHSSSTYFSKYLAWSTR